MREGGKNEESEELEGVESFFVQAEDGIREGISCLEFRRVLFRSFAAEYAHHNDTKVTKDHYIKARTGAENRSKILQIRREKGL